MNRGWMDGWMDGNLTAAPGTCRRWQGLVLALWGAAAAVPAAGNPNVIPACYSLLVALLEVPAMCELGHATPTGRGILRQVFESVLEVGREHPCLSVWGGAKDSRRRRRLADSVLPPPVDCFYI